MAPKFVDGEVVEAKKGCTVMLLAELFSSQVLAPFIVMTGKRNATLQKKYNNWDGPSCIRFQESHWMDKPTAIDYLDFIRECFPHDAIGLVWDSASMHISDDVLTHAKNIGIVIETIPAGMTSIIQVCDLLCNKPIKQYFKRRYQAWKMRQNIPAGNKYKVKREDVISWLELSILDSMKSTMSQEALSQCFVPLDMILGSGIHCLSSKYTSKNC